MLTHLSGYQLMDKSSPDTFPIMLSQLAYLKVNPKFTLFHLKLFQDIALQNEAYLKKCDWGLVRRLRGYKHLLHKHKDLSLSYQHLCQCQTHLSLPVTPALEGGDRQIAGVCWPASLAEMVPERPCLRKLR